MLVTALNPHIGYEKAAQISIKAYREDTTLKRGGAVAGLPDGRAIRQVGPPRGHERTRSPSTKKRNDGAGLGAIRLEKDVDARLDRGLDVFAADQSTTPNRSRL